MFISSDWHLDLHTQAVLVGSGISADMDNPASVQAIVADICVEKFGQEIPQKRHIMDKV